MSTDPVQKTPMSGIPPKPRTATVAAGADADPAAPPERDTSEP